MTTKSTRKSSSISPPLPLPVGFALLPSLLPGRNLVPFLYTTLNDIPIYLSLSPTSPPHLSFLSLILALNLPDLSTPLALLTQSNLHPSQYTLDISGNAPWLDIWLPLDIARSVIKQIKGAQRLFWDKDIPGRGLLGLEAVDGAVSWEEEGGWVHNWTPNKSHLAPSTYCMHTLLTTQWPGIDLIADDRCINTPTNASETGRLRSEGIHGDPSRIRHGRWAKAWDVMIQWTTSAWEEYARYPVGQKEPAIIATGSRPREPLLSNSHTAHSTWQPLDVLPLLPALIYPRSKASSPLTLYTSDLINLFPTDSPTSIFSLLSLLFQAVLAAVKRVLRRPQRLLEITPGQIAKLEWRARVQLALVNLIGDIMVAAWQAGRERSRLEAMVEGLEEVSPVIVHGGKSKATRVSSRKLGGRGSIPQGDKESIAMKDNARIERPRQSANAVDEDTAPIHTRTRTVEQLEQLRGASPPPERDSTKSPIQSRRHHRLRTPGAKSPDPNASENELAVQGRHRGALRPSRQMESNAGSRPPQATRAASSLSRRSSGASSESASPDIEAYNWDSISDSDPEELSTSPTTRKSDVVSIEADLPPESGMSKYPPPDYRISEAEQKMRKSDESGPALSGIDAPVIQTSTSGDKKCSAALETTNNSDILPMPSPEKLVASDQPPLVTELSTPLPEVIAQANPIRQASKSRISIRIGFVTMGFMALLLALWYAGGPTRPDIPSPKFNQHGHGLAWIRAIWSERLWREVDVVKKEGWWDGIWGLVRRS